MRALAVAAVVLGMGTLAHAYDPARTNLNPAKGLSGSPSAAAAKSPPVTAARPQAIDYFATDGLVWRRMPNGATHFWQNGQWREANSPQERTVLKPVIDNPAPPATTSRARRYGRNPDVIITYPQDETEGGLFKGNPFFGGGRGRFSS